jgi:hypothetical protein
MFTGYVQLALASGVALLRLAQAAEVQGFDISNYQPNVDFGAAYSSGARFVIIKVTKLSFFTSPSCQPSLLLRPKTRMFN